jgi:hypothetical protein
MARLLFTVEDTFLITGHGLVLVPGIAPEGEERFRSGDPILLKRPDGSEIASRIDGLELCTPNPKHLVAILLKAMNKVDVPVRPQVWSVDQFGT